MLGITKVRGAEDDLPVAIDDLAVSFPFLDLKTAFRHDSTPWTSRSRAAPPCGGKHREGDSF